MKGLVVAGFALLASQGFGLSSSDRTVGTVEVMEREFKINGKACDAEEPILSDERMTLSCFDHFSKSNDYEVLNAGIKLPSEISDSARIFTDEPLSAKKKVNCAGSYRVTPDGAHVSVSIFRGIKTESGGYSPQRLELTDAEKSVAKNLLKACAHDYATLLSKQPDQKIRFVVLRKHRE